MKGQDDSILKTGTTIVGLKGKDYVILAADKKTSAGNFIVSTETKKLRQISPSIAIGAAGTVGDFLQVIRILKAELNMYESERAKEMSPRALSTFMSNLLNGNRYYPYFTGLVLIGYKSEPELYSTDSVGGLSKFDTFTATGSGSDIAMGVLEHMYRPNLSKDDAIKLAVSAVNAAKKRDAFSGGDSVDLMVITKSGTEELSK